MNTRARDVENDKEIYLNDAVKKEIKKVGDLPLL